MDRPYTPAGSTRRKKNLGLSTREYAKARGLMLGDGEKASNDASQVADTIASVRKSRQYEAEIDEDLGHDAHAT